MGSDVAGSVASAEANGKLAFDIDDLLVRFDGWWVCPPPGSGRVCANHPDALRPEQVGVLANRVFCSRQGRDLRALLIREGLPIMRRIPLDPLTSIVNTRSVLVKPNTSRRVRALMKSRCGRWIWIWICLARNTVSESVKVWALTRWRRSS